MRDVPAPVPGPAADLTEQDRGAIHAFLAHSTELLQGNARLQQVMRTVAAQDRTLQMLVSKDKECPSLFWFYPKKPELRRWLSDPAKCLFQDTLMMVVVCPVTLCVVECGPDGVGWEVTKPKEWVKKWGPAILFSIYVMQAAVLAGRVVGIPLPPPPGAAEIEDALGLKGMLSDVFCAGGSQVNLKDSLRALRDTTTAALDQTPAARALCAGTRDGSVALPVDLPVQMVGEAYKSIHTFLTTGENATLGKLEDQLRGRMERVKAPDGDIEWVSVQGRDAWLQKHANAVVYKIPTASKAHSLSSAPEPPTWLGERLAAAGIAPELVQLCDRVLVREEGFGSEKRLARTPSGEFDRAYLASVGITGRGLQLELLDLHRELRVSAKKPSPPGTPQGKKIAAELLTEEDVQHVRRQRLKEKEQVPTTTHTVDRGNQMQYTASAFNQRSPQGAQDHRLAKELHAVKMQFAQTQDALSLHITGTSLQLEDHASKAELLHDRLGAVLHASRDASKKYAEIAARLAVTDANVMKLSADVAAELDDVKDRMNGLTPPANGSSGKESKKGWKW
jgi:hypothetical protein